MAIGSRRGRPRTGDDALAAMTEKKRAFNELAVTPAAQTPEGRRELARLMAAVVEASPRDTFHHGLNAAFLTELLGRLAGEGEEWAWQDGLERVDGLLGTVPPDDWRHALYLLAQAALYYGRAATTTALPDIDAALPLLDDAARSVGPRSGIRATAAAFSGDLFLRRYSLTGRPEDLESGLAAAIHLGDVPEDKVLPRDVFVAAQTLARGYAWRYELLGEARDAVAALAMSDLALETVEAELPQRLPEVWDVRASAYRAAHRVTGDPAHLDTAIEAYRKALATSEDPLDRATGLDNLGNGLADRAASPGGDVDDLREAVDCSRSALALMPPEEVNHRAVSLRNWAVGVEQLAEAGGLTDDEFLREIDAVTTAVSELVRTAGPATAGAQGERLTQEELARLQAAGGGLLLRRAALSGEPLGPLDEALDLLAAAHAAWMRPFLASTPYRLGASRRRGFTEAYVGALIWRAELSEDPQPWLRRALMVGEASKARLLSGQVQRIALDPPAAVDRELAEEEQLLLGNLARLEGQELRHFDSTGHDPLRVIRMHRRATLANRLEDVWRRMASVSEDAARYVAVRQGLAAHWTGLIEDADPGLVVLSALRYEHVPGMGRRPDRQAVLAMRGGSRGVHLAWSDEDRTADAVRRFEAEVPSARGRGRRAQTWHTRVSDAFERLALDVGPADDVLLSVPTEGWALPWAVVLEQAGWRDAGGRPSAVVMVPSLGLLHHPRRAGMVRWHFAVDASERTGDRDDDGLGETISISEQVDAGPAVDDPLVVGNPTEDLPGAEREAEAVAARYGVPPLLRERATRGEVRDRLGGARVAHLAAHAVADADDFLASFVRLADGRLTVDEVIGRYVRTGLVVLSACEGAGGSPVAGQEVVGLAQALLRAGVDTVVASLWRVDDEVTQALMTAFHEEYAGGTPAGRALRDATLRIRRVPEWRPTYFSSGFVAMSGVIG